MRSNKRMKKDLPRASALSNRLRGLPARLALVVRSGAIERDGCVVSSRLHGWSPGVGLGDFPDRTGLECYVNKIHVDEYVAGSSTRRLAFALKYVNAWSEYLARKFRDHRFRFIVSTHQRDCTVRFHCIRPGESFLADPDASDGEEGILELDQDELPRKPSRRLRGFSALKRRLGTALEATSQVPATIAPPDSESEELLAVFIGDSLSAE